MHRSRRRSGLTCSSCAVVRSEFESFDRSDITEVLERIDGMEDNGKVVAHVVRGAIAGALGTIAMDLLWFERYTRSDGKASFLAWETSAGLDSWTDAPAPAAVGQIIAKRIFHRDLAPTHARTASNAMHWATGIGWGMLYSVRGPNRLNSPIVAGALFGTMVWLQSYAVLGTLRLYKPIWQYDARTLCKDLSAHLVYGATTGSTISILAGYR
ncbi:hypothetical protein HQ346_04550 [Rhodococcus sp. BP-252]|nr:MULTISPECIES: hypothetical protein [unclassified Rhodococcus (in: high G+C Gram-positive bacteria)]MBY6439432.1 hypothetical protein [Rhodococcus sp. BP-319]MBY6508585.1 hypothetical protein [Rhodococcus sp. BP-147]MBY6523081.1 hypothetical protein [Rhodococcus sp. BP-252]MBY6566880.1 hypothetical protein [Rhodococcus sp. BP-154]